MNFRDRLIRKLRRSGWGRGREVCSPRRDWNGAALFLDHDFGGGANVWRELEIARRRAAGERCETVISQFRPDRSGDFRFGSGGWSPDPTPLLRRAAWSEIVVNSLAGFPGIEHFLEWLAEAPSPVTVLFHDFYPVCPSLNLIGSDGRYCRVPADCGACPARLRLEYHPETVDPVRWRARWRPVLERAVNVIFSESSREPVLSAYPGIPLTLRPHDTSFIRFGPVSLERGSGLRVGVLGNLHQTAKGGDAVAALAAAHPELEIVIFGEYGGNARSNLRCVGPYTPATLPSMLRKTGVNVIWFPSIWPETFSFVTSEIMAMRLPLVLFDLGAPAERAREYTPCRIVGDPSPESVYAAMTELYREVYR